MLIRDRVVCGINDPHLTERFLREKAESLTLLRVSEMARASEASKEQMKTLRGETSKNPSSLHVDEVKTKSNSRNERRKTYNCWKCGTVHMYRQCPAFGAQCRKCKGYNHYAKNCNSSKRDTKSQSAPSVEQIDVEDYTKEGQWYKLRNH